MGDWFPAFGHPQTPVHGYYYCTTVLLLYYCTSALLLYHYCTTTVLPYYYCTTKQYQASDFVDCGGECN